MCPKSFKYPDQLNRHHLEHTMQEKIKCMYCDKRFVRTSELRQHMRLFHSGVIYTCHVCHESCAHKHTIVRHYRRKHPELADVFEKQPDFLETLQKPVDKSAAMSSVSCTVFHSVCVCVCVCVRACVRVCCWHHCCSDVCVKKIVFLILFCFFAQCPCCVC